MLVAELLMRRSLPEATLDPASGCDLASLLASSNGEWKTLKINDASTSSSSSAGISLLLPSSWCSLGPTDDGASSEEDLPSLVTCGAGQGAARGSELPRFERGVR